MLIQMTARTKSSQASDSIYLGRSLFALIGAGENVERQGNSSGAGRVLLRTLIDVDASQVDIDAWCSPF